MRPKLFHKAGIVAGVGHRQVDSRSSRGYMDGSSWHATCVLHKMHSDRAGGTKSANLNSLELGLGLVSVVDQRRGLYPTN